jgi:DNA repair exonuclease SbcCD ATPase subunit
MKVTHLKLLNVMGIPELEIKAGALTEISGRNGSGKTSILEGIKFALGGGSDATLMRKGADHQEVVITFDDGVVVKKTVDGAAPAKLSVTDPVRGKVDKAQTWLNSVVDELGVNPMAFLLAPAAKQADLLLAALPMEVTLPEILAAVRDDKNRDYFERVLGGFKLKPGEHALAAISRARQTAYEERTAVNRQTKESEATIKQLSEGLDPSLLDSNWSLRLSELRNSEVEARSGLQKLRDGGTEAKQRATAEVYARRDSEIASHKAELEQKITALREAFVSDTEVLRSDVDTEVERIDAGIAAKFAADTAAASKEVEAITTEIATVKEKASQAERAAALDTTIKERVAALAESVARGYRLTDILLGMDSLKAERMKQIPVQGLEVSDGSLLIDGVEFHRINTARQIAVAIEVARLRAKKIGVVCVDGMERLDHDAFAEFERQAEASGLQFIVTRVTDTDLAVNGVEVKAS